MFVKHFAITYIEFFYSIQDAMNRTEDLVLHQPQAENKTTQPSMNVKIWFERGTLLKKKVLEPKLMWSVLNGVIVFYMIMRIQTKKKSLMVIWIWQTEC